MTSAFRYSGVLCLFAGLACAAGEPRVSGPYTYDNLAVYLLHAGGPAASGARLLTLREALDAKKVAVYETGSVGELAIENLSSEPVYVQAGEIVKGGRQDRVLTTDLVLRPHSGKLPVSSFCVEQGRWSRRGQESAQQFDSSSRMVATKTMKLAVREPGAQGRVWDGVAEAQAKLAAGAVAVAGDSAHAAPAAAAPVRAAASPSSMQLTLESKPVVDSTAAYVKALGGIVEGKPDAVGYAYAINGEISGGDVYGSPDLFRRMWPKLAEASATEAVAERGKPAKAAPAAAAVKQALAEAGDGRESSRTSAGSAVVVRKDTAKAVVFDSREEGRADLLHRAWVTR